MNYLTFILLNSGLICLFFYSKVGFFISGFILIISGLIYYFYLVDREKLFKKNYEAHNFIKYAELYYYNSNLSISYMSLSNETSLLVNKKEEYEKLDILDRYYQYMPFSIFVEVFKSNLDLESKIKVFSFVSNYSSYWLNLNSNSDNRNELSNLYVMILYSNLIFVIINVLFPLNELVSCYFVYGIIYCLQIVVVLISLVKFYKVKRCINNSLIEFLIYSCYLSSKVSFEKMMANLLRIYVSDFKNLVVSYEKQNFYQTLVLIRKYQDDLAICEVLNYMYRVSIGSGVDIKLVDNLIVSLSKENKMSLSGVKSIVYFLFLIGILFFIYRILIDYEAF